MKVQLDTTHGTIMLELDAEKAPQTVASFVNYVNDQHYDGTIFHRVISGFMIQGGGMLPGLEQKDTGPSVRNEADNGLSNVTGSIAMARTSDPHSASCQFFINVKDNDFLDHTAPTPQGWGYCVFGKVVEGMDVVTAIEGVATGTQGGMGDGPHDDVVIEKATVVDA